jgi:hypothetical protein
MTQHPQRGAGLLAALLVSASPTTASGGGLEIHWSASDPSCPSQSQMLVELEHMIDDEGEPYLIVFAWAERNGETWELSVESESVAGHSQRLLTGKDCAELADALVPVIELAIVEVGAIAGALDESSEAEAAPQALRLEPPKFEFVLAFTSRPAGAEPAQRSDPLPTPSRRPRLGIRLQSGASYGDLPGVGPILRLGTALQWPHARLEIEAHHAFARRARSPAGTGADLRQTFGVIRGCGIPRLRHHPVEFPLCLGLEVGAIYGNAVGLEIPRSDGGLWMAVDVTQGITWVVVPNFAVGLSIEPWVSVLDARFSFDGANGREIWRPHRFGVRSVAGMEVRF